MSLWRVGAGGARKYVGPRTVDAHNEKRPQAPACGTEAGYQRHRIDGPWPLPPDDPCGCRDAHRQHYHRLLGQKEIAKHRAEKEDAT